ncbi:hypothetical protein [Streptomyces sp. NPDC057686]|uniref:hypothetical protein n=1 Tax=Streptomyces sp. NPDC057686 TaxID=3346212 RepID=UPI0036777075
MRELLEKIEDRQAAARDEADRLREQIAHLTDRLAGAERVLERLQITRKTLLEIAGDDDRPPVFCRRPTARFSPCSRTPTMVCMPKMSAGRSASEPSPAPPKAPAPS